MTGPDDAVVDLTSELDVLDLIGQQAVPPDSDVARLVAALREPASPEELRDQVTVVGAMQAALRRTGAAAMASLGSPGSRRLVRRVAVAKGAAVLGAIAFGVTAAAATTGMVDLTELPGWPAKAVTTTEPVATEPVGTQDATSERSNPDHGADDLGRDAGPAGPAAATPGPTGAETQATEPGTGEGAVDDAVTSTSDGAAASDLDDTAGSTTSTTTATTLASTTTVPDHPDRSSHPGKGKPPVTPPGSAAGVTTSSHPPAAPAAPDHQISPSRVPS